MTEPSDPDQSVADAIRALRGSLFSFGRSTPWEDLRGRIRHLLIGRRPTPDERLQLLEVYDIVVTRVERQCGEDHRRRRRLGCQRALDTLAFLFAELRDHGHEPGVNTAQALFVREHEAGRLRLDGHFAELMSVVLGRSGDEGGSSPAALREDGAPFIFPPGFSLPPAIPSSPPGP